MLDNLLFIDIETIPSVPEYDVLPDRMKKQWERKAKFFRNDDEQSAAEQYEDRGGIYAEFGKVICISIGYFTQSITGLKFRVLPIFNDDEFQLLNDFKLNLSKFPESNLRLCAHNGKEFDYPYLCRRLLINGIKLPPVLQISGKKPWEINLVDTMELWKFGDFKNFTSLDLLAAIFGVESSKSDIDGSQVSTVYYKEKNLKKIAEYCSRDVVVTAQVYLHLLQLEPISDENIIIIDK